MSRDENLVKKGAARERWISSFVLLRDRKPGIERMRECEKKKEREREEGAKIFLRKQFPLRRS